MGTGHSVLAALGMLWGRTLGAPKVRMAHIQTLRGVNNRCKLFASLQQVSAALQGPDEHARSRVLWRGPKRFCGCSFDYAAFSHKI